MLGRITGTAELAAQIKEEREKLTGVLHRVDELENAKTTFEATLGVAKENIATLEGEKELFSNALGYITTSLTDARESFNAEIQEMNQLRNQLKKSVSEELMMDFRQVLREETQRIRTDAQAYRELVGKINSVGQELSIAQQHLQKMNSIASQLKEKDFALERYAKKLEDQNGEKLRLMQKIDKLEHLLAKERRK